MQYSKASFLFGELAFFNGKLKRENGKLRSCRKKSSENKLLFPTKSIVRLRRKFVNTVGRKCCRVGKADGGIVGGE